MADNVEKKKVVTELEFRVNEQQLRKAELALKRVEAQTARVRATRGLISDKKDLEYVRRGTARTRAVGALLNTREKLKIEKERGRNISLRTQGALDREAERRNTYYTKNALRLDELSYSAKLFRQKELARRTTLRSRTANTSKIESERRLTASLRSQLRQSDATQGLYVYEQKMKANVGATYEKWFARTQSQEEILNAKREYDYEKYINTVSQLEETLHLKKMAMQDKYNMKQENDLKSYEHAKRMYELKEQERKRQDVRQAFKKAEIEENKKKRNFIMRSGFKATPILSSTQIGAQQDPTFWFKKNNSGLFQAPKYQYQTVKDNPKSRAINKAIDDGILNSIKSKMSFASKKKAGGHSYFDSKFQRSMMYLGSAMLIQYAVMIGARTVAGTLNATANTEVASLQGRAFRNDLIKRGGNVAQFDSATNEYSRLSGTAEYASRAKMANLFGRLRGAGINTNAINGKQLVQTMRGLELYTGDTPEQVDKKLFDLLSGKAEKNTRKEFGVTATNNPTEILKQIHQTLLRNPVASIGMNQSLLKDTLNKVVQAPNKMLDNVHSRFPEIFYDIGESISNFTDGFFGNLDPDVEKRWIALFGTMRSFIDQVVTAESGGTVAKFLTDTVGVFFANLRDTAIAVNKGIDYVNKEGTVGNKAFNVGKFLWNTNRYLRDPFSMYRDAMDWYNDKPSMPLATPYGGSYLTGNSPTNIINGNNIYIDGANVKIDSKLNEVTY